MARYGRRDPRVPRRKRPCRGPSALPEREPALELVTAGRPWSFDSDGHLFRLARRRTGSGWPTCSIRMLAVHTSLVDPLPHQITAVYGEMLSRQPLRFLLADDPGAGKTIMAGLLIKELMIRGDLRRCMIVCPGMLVEQWQDELDRRFGLPFEIMTNDKLEAARTGNWLLENDLVICRLDKLSRDEDLQEKLKQTDWDLSSSTRRTRCAPPTSGRGQVHEALPARASWCPASRATSSS